MRYGCCVSPEWIGVVAEVGFDFCELPARAVLPMASDGEALPALRAIAEARLRPESFNSLIPGEIPLCGPHADSEQLRGYFTRAFGRMASLGAEVAVLGSGAARKIPDGWPREQALDQLANAFAIAAEEANRANITLSIEHLNKGECNVFNTVGESYDFVLERGLSGIYILADLFHLELEQEPFENVVRAAPLLRHVHTAGGGRGAPDIPGYDYAGFVKALKQAGYNARISAECSWNDLAAQGPGALAFMRAGWEA
jgi:sugar phosphate isomerase/epimerase